MRVQTSSSETETECTFYLLNLLSSMCFNRFELICNSPAFQGSLDNSVLYGRLQCDCDGFIPPFAREDIIEQLELTQLHRIILGLLVQVWNRNSRFQLRKLIHQTPLAELP
jgi:hypothetical protein